MRYTTRNSAVYWHPLCGKPAFVMVRINDNYEPITYSADLEMGMDGLFTAKCRSCGAREPLSAFTQVNFISELRLQAALSRLGVDRLTQAVMDGA